VKKTLAFLMLFTYLSALFLPCFCKAETELCYEVEQQKKDAEPDEENFLQKEILPFEALFSSNLKLIQQQNHLRSSKINPDLLLHFQDKNSPIFSPPPEFYS
jgi:hypothetical protein